MARRLFSRFLIRRLVLLTAFGIAFGHVEAVAMVYLGRVMGWVRLPADLGPDDLAGLPGWLIHAEQTRAAATIIVLLAVAYLVGRNFLERAATLLFALGVWRIAYYIALRVMTGWPESLRTADRFFLSARPWSAPVWILILGSVAVTAAAIGLMLAIDRHQARVAREA